MVLDHPTHEYVLGPDYPYYFKTPEEFESMLENLPEKFDWKLPHMMRCLKRTLLIHLQMRFKTLLRRK